MAQPQQFFTEQVQAELPRQEVVLFTEEEERVPLLCLDVNLGQGIAPQIVIYAGDDV